jgi:hypothetical protein
MVLVPVCLLQYGFISFVIQWSNGSTYVEYGEERS